jgi:SAM-dependent methyltransferase
MGVQLDEFKTRQRAMWAAGDFATLAEHIGNVGALLVDRVGVDPGMRVLDVACGTGNAAIPAAQSGATVTGLDLVPLLLDGGRERASAVGVDVEWVEGDAEALPFESDSFERVLSTFGHMFAPRHERAAAEMVRVCAAGGVIGICCWTPEGSAGDVQRAVGAFMPAPPEYASPPLLWGTEDHVREMFGGARDFEFERHSATIQWESNRGFADYFMDRFGPMVAAREMLGDRFEDLKSEVIEIWDRWNEADDGSFRLPQEYLLAVVHV